MTEDWRWNDLVAHATLGTGRRGDLPRRTLVGLDLPVDGTVEDRLLRTAAAAWAARRTSLRPQPVGSIDPRWAAPTEESLTVAPGPALELLDAILSGLVAGPDRGALLTRWLAEAASAGWRIASHHLTDVLDEVPRPVPAEAVAAVGRQGRWLASLGRSRWADALIDVATAEEQLAIGGRQRRVAATRLWSAAPDRGHAIVSERWGHWPAAVRTDVLEAVGALVGPDDEPWLEAALGDETPRVRHAAARALATLPGSRRADRMADRLPGMLQLERRRLRTDTMAIVDVRPTAADLTDATAAPPPVGLTAWWHAQVLSAAPRRGWERVVGSLDGAVEVLGDHPLLLLGAARAAADQRDDTFADRLRPLLLATHEAPLPPGSVLPPGGDRWMEGLRDLLALVAGPWPAALTDEVVSWCATHPRPGTALGTMVTLLVTRAGPTLDDRLATARPSGPHARMVASAIDRIRLSRSLHRAIDTMASDRTATAEPHATTPDTIPTGDAR